MNVDDADFTWLACRNRGGVIWKGHRYPCLMDDCGGKPCRRPSIVNAAGQDFRDE